MNPSALPALGTVPWCPLGLHSSYLAEKADVEAQGLRVPGARVHVVAQEEHQLQELAEALTLLELLAGQGHCHDVRLDVVHVLLKHQPEQDPVEPRAQHLHRAHLHSQRQNNLVICENTDSPSAGQTPSYSCCMLSLPLLHFQV